jgi:hypothetical protein
MAIVERIMAAKQKKIKQYPVNSNRASDLGHPCVKYHVLNRTRWQEKELHDATLQAVFDLGNEFEQIIMKDLNEAGIPVIEQQRPFEWREYQITGHIDGKLLVDGEIVPFDAKSCSPFVFDYISDINSLKRGKYPYLRKYPTQLNLYMLMSNHERGLLLFKNKVSGLYKEVWMDLDYELGEETLQRAEAINRHLAEGTEPEPINDPFWCNDCPYVHICRPAITGTEFEILDDNRIAEMLDRLEELKPYVQEHKQLDDELKKILEGKEKLLVGNWIVTGKWMERKGYDIPSEIKEKYVTVTKYWKRNIEKVTVE